MKKLFLAIIILGVAMLLSTGYQNLTNSQLTVAGVNITAIKQDLSSLINGTKNFSSELKPDQAESKDVAQSNQGEIHIEGEIKKLKSKPRAIEIKLHAGDHHDQVENPILIAKRAKFYIRDQQVNFSNLQAGDIVGIILNQQGKARKITVYNRTEE
ncbi:MAG: hypothetical protein ACQEQI_06250 [Bacillota bacterium]